MKFGEILKLKEDPEYKLYPDVDFKFVAGLSEVKQNIKKAKVKSAKKLNHLDYGFIVHNGEKENRVFVEKGDEITAWTWEEKAMEMTPYGHDLHGYEDKYTVVGNLKDIEISDELI